MFLPWVALAQQDLPTCWDIDYGMYPRQIKTGGDPLNAPQNTILNKGLVKLTDVNEANVTFSKRMWSSIELKEKANHHLYYPAKPKPNLWSLWTVIRYSLEVEQSLTAYDPGIEQDDSFKYPIRPTDSTYCEGLKSLLYREVYVDSLDENGEPIYDSLIEETLQTSVLQPITSEQIIRYVIKEDWFFDRERSTMEKRILGIAPVVEMFDEFGDIKGYRILFWLYFPECEYVFQSHIAYQREVHPKSVSYTDLFRKRQFTSVVIKESNMAGAKLNSGLNGKDALLESDRLKRQHNNLEHDLWSY